MTEFQKVLQQEKRIVYMRKFFFIYWVCVPDAVSFFEDVDVGASYDCAVRVFVRAASSIQAGKYDVCPFTANLVSCAQDIDFSRDDADYEVFSTVG